MAPSFTIARDTGSILIGEIAVLEPEEGKSTVEPKVRDLINGSRDHGNGYEWLYLNGLSFGGRPAGLSLCFHDNLLEQASWSVQLLHAATEGGWPARDEIDAEWHLSAERWPTIWIFAPDDFRGAKSGAALTPRAFWQLMGFATVALKV